MESEFTFCGKTYTLLDKTEKELQELEYWPWDYVITPEGQWTREHNETV